MPLLAGSGCRRWIGAAFAGVLLMTAPAAAQDARIHYVDQGPQWTPEARNQYYSQNEGSRLIPLAWLRGLRQTDGTPFLASLERYGFLPNPDPANRAGLPVGFTRAGSPQGAMIGMTCSACHVRQIVVDQATYRIDGGPAIVDFAAFTSGLDDAVHRALADDASFKTFAQNVLGATAADETASQQLHAEVRIWWVRFHALVAGSLPDKRPWGPTRLDAISVIYNFLAGLDAGPPPTYVAPGNIQKGDAPVRYPFLWNVRHQDHTQWTGVADFGNDELATARSLSEIFGVFAQFRPVETPGAVSALNRSYLLHNSTYFDGFKAIDGLMDRMGAPKWPWPVDTALADKGKAIFARPTSQGGCVDCHGQTKGVPRPPVEDTWKTPIVDVGTDTRAWQVLLRTGGTGSFEGASVPGAIPPIKAQDLSLNLLKVSVAGTLVDKKAKSALDHPLPTLAVTAFAASKAEPTDGKPLPPANRYEARVLYGVWAAAPYLHNASVPTLADLLKPAAERPKDFKIGPNYDAAAVGMATQQTAFDFTLHATGCDDRNSGDSNCGHDYGTSLPANDKKALLEYLKTL